jgi:competence protein ComEC
MKRPLLLVGLLYVGGVLAGDCFSIPGRALLAILGCLTLISLAWAKGRAALLYPIITLAGWTNIALDKAAVSPVDLRRLVGHGPALVTVRGALTETPVVRSYEGANGVSWRTHAKVRVAALCPNKGEWTPALGNIVVSSAGELTNLFAGQTIEVTGVMSPPASAVAPGLFDYRSYLSRLGYYFQLQAASEKDWQIILSPRSWPLSDRFRVWGRQALSIGLPYEDESLRLEWALTLGWKPALTEEVSEPFIRAATYHIFAVDGLRMAIIFGIFLGLLRAASVPRAIIGVLLIPVIWFYVALTGWPASAIRASVMLTIVIIGWALRRPGELINSLFAAALLILVWQPQQLFQAGFQLSFFVVLCIILMVPVLNKGLEKVLAPDPFLPTALHRRWPPIIRVPAWYVWEVVATSFAAWIGSIPLAAYYFNIVSPVSTPANLLAVPACALVLMANLAALLLAPVFPAAAAIFNHAGWGLMELIRVSSEWFAHWPRAYAYVAAPTWFTMGIFYALFIAAITGWLFQPTWRRIKYSLASALVLSWALLCWHEASITRLTILPVNGSQAIFFDPPGVRNDLLLDCGREHFVNSVVKPFLRAQGVNDLAGFVLTQGDARRIGGAELLASAFRITRTYASAVPSRSPAYRRFVEDCRHTPGRLIEVSRDDVIGPWTVLHPERDDRFSQSDDNALVLHGTVGGVRILLLSDLGKAGQSAVLARTPNLRADIVIGGLPNKGEPLSDSLLEIVQPRLIIVTDSEFPVQQRASAALKNRLSKTKAQVLYTRSTGSITLDLIGKDRWQLKTMTGDELADQEPAERPASRTDPALTE